MQLNCLNCKTLYEEAEPEPYYCPPCLTLKKAFAEEIDKKRSFNPSVKVKSELELYDEARKASGRPFPNANQFLH